METSEFLSHPGTSPRKIPLDSADRELKRPMLACFGTQQHARLLSTPKLAGVLDGGRKLQRWVEHRFAIESVRERFDYPPNRDKIF